MPIHADPSHDGAPRQKTLIRYGVGLVVLVIGLTCTSLATWALHRAVTTRDKERFVYGAAQAREAVTSRLDTYTAMLRAAAGLYAASERVSRQEFHEFVARLELERMYPGVQGIGFTARAPGGGKEPLEARGREEWAGVLDFHVWPSEPERDEYHAILFLEPLDERNRRAIGFDMFSEPIRRAAMAAARDTGLPAMTRRVTLVQESDKHVQPGFLVYVPVYKSGAAIETVEERRDALLGFVYSPFRATDLFTQVFAPTSHSRTGVTVYDGTERDDEHLLYRDPGRAQSRPALQGSDTITFAGGVWTLDYHTLPGFELASGRALVLPVFFAGVAISALLAFIAGREARARAAAVAAREDVRAAGAQLRQTLDTAAVGLVRVGRDLRYIAANPAYAQIAGLPLESIVGRPMSEVVGEKGLALIRPHIDRVLAGQRVEYEMDLPWAAAGRKRIHVVYTPWHEPDGSVSGWVASITDVTARATAEEAMRVSEARKSAVLDTALDAVVMMDAQGRVVDFNPAAESTFGYSRAEALGQDMASLIIPPAYRQAHRDGLRRHIGGAQGPVVNKRLEMTAQRKGGAEFPVELTITRTDVGGVVLFTGYLRDISERRRSEALLRESEARFRSFFDSLDQGFGLIEVFHDSRGRPDYRFVEVNRAFEEQMGLSDVLGRSFRELIPGHEEHWFELYERVAATGVPERVVNEARQLGRWYDVYAARVGGESSRTLAVLFRDITQLRRAQERDRLLLKLEDTTRALDDPRQITDAAAQVLGRHLHVNRCAYADVDADEDAFNLTGDYTDGVPSIVGRYRFGQFGRECLRLMRANAPFVVDDSETDPRCAEFLDAYRPTAIRAVICVPLHKGGRLVAAMAVHNSRPRHWRQDEVELLQTVSARCWESIERARVARDLRAGEERYKAFIANSSEGIWRLEIDPPLDTTLSIEQQLEHVYRYARFAECNDVMARMYGLSSPAQLIGQNLEMMLPSSDPKARAYIASILQAGYRIADVESEEKDARGNTVYFSNSMVGVFDPVDPTRLIRVWGTQRDVSARRAAEEELTRYRNRLEVMVQERTLQLETAAKRLRDSERLASLGTLTAGLGHDLHNALLPLRVHVEELESAARTDERVRHNASAIAAVVGYLAELSRGMRMLAMDPGQEGAAAVTDPVQWQADAGRIFQSGVGRGIEVTTRADAACPSIAIAPHRLTQAVFNLVQNAREAVHARHGETKNGRIDIHIRCAEDADFVEVAVTDNGTGMNEEVRRRCMEPFFTTRSRSAGRSGAGTGMGLSIVAGIVTATGGRVEIDSTPGLGSRFRLLIPAAREPAEEHARPRPKALVEIKDPRRSAFVTALLTASGWDVTTSGSADGASLLVADPRGASPEEVRAFVGGNRRALIVGVPEESAAAYRAPGVTMHAAARPLAELREVVEGLGRAH